MGKKVTRPTIPKKTAKTGVVGGQKSKQTGMCDFPIKKQLQMYDREHSVCSNCNFAPELPENEVLVPNLAFWT